MSTPPGASGASRGPGSATAFPGSHPGSSHQASSLRPWSCVACRRRKVRCDRRSPCSNCARTSSECVFPVSGRLLRQQDDATRLAKKNQVELLARLKRLEGVVEDLTSQLKTPVEGGGSDTGGLPGSQQEDDDVVNLEEEVGRLVIDESGSRYVGNRFWVAFQEEVKHIREGFEDDDKDPDIDSSDTSFLQNSSPRAASEEYRLDSHHFPFRQSPSRDGYLKTLHPLPSQVLFIWQTYVENVDLFSKSIHVPTFTKKLRDLNGDFSSLNPGMEALMFAIYLCAVSSLSDEEVEINFHTERAQLLARYRTGTEIALSRADFVNTTDITVVQAFIIYLQIMHTLESERFVWSMMGLLLRIAVSVGLHRDGSNFPHISPFETEIRRRMWWQICFIDSRSGADEAADVSITARMFDTKLPTNVNDADIYPEMRHAPVARVGMTETASILIRFELWSFGRRNSASLSALKSSSSERTPSTQEQVELCRQTRARIDEKFFQNIESGPPFAVFLRAGIHYILTRLELIIYYRLLFPVGSTKRPSEAESEQLLSLALLVLNQTTALATDPIHKRWAWQLRGVVQWHALCILVSQLCIQPWTPSLDSAWSTAERTFDAVPEGAKAHPLWSPLSKLMARAQKRHDEYQSHQAAPLKQTSSTQRELLPSLAVWEPTDEEIAAATDFSAAGTLLGITRSGTASSTDGAVTASGLGDAKMVDTTDWEAWDGMILQMMDSGEAPDLGFGI